MGSTVATGIENGRKNARAVAIWTNMRFLSEARRKAFGGSRFCRGSRLELSSSSIEAGIVILFCEKEFHWIKDEGGEPLSSSRGIGASFEVDSC